MPARSDRSGTRSREHRHCLMRVLRKGIFIEAAFAFVVSGPRDAGAACAASQVIVALGAPQTIVMTGEYFLAVKLASSAWLADPSEKGYALRDQLIAVSREGRFLQVRFEPRRRAIADSIGGKTALGQEVYYIVDARRSRIICRRYAM